MHASIDKRLRALVARALAMRTDLLPTLFDRAARKYMVAQRYRVEGKIDETTFTFVEEQFFTVRRICQERHVLVELQGV